MSELIRPHHSLTVEEYLELEETAEIRHEYVGGNVYAMTGATKRLNRIVGNIYRGLADAAEDGPCRVYVEGVKLASRQRRHLLPGRDGGVRSR